MTWSLVAFNKFSKKIEISFEDIDDMHSATMNGYRLAGTSGLIFGWVYKK